MFGTIENINSKILEKISSAERLSENIQNMVVVLRHAVQAHKGKKYANAVEILDRLRLNLTRDDIETINNNYTLSVIPILNEYYDSSDNEDKNTKDYYRIITSENFVVKINDCIARLKSTIKLLYDVLGIRLLSKIETTVLENQLDVFAKTAEKIHGIDIHIIMEKRNYEICKCNTRMIVIPELSELHCPNPVCCKIKTIVGAVFRDDQFYPQEGQKTKHGGYDTTRHYRFWIERLQALESKTFDDTELDKIEYVLNRDKYDRKDLTCENIRDILKDPKVKLTCLNDHAPLLVKLFGGIAPPRLDFHENKVISIKFNKAMRLYDVVNPEGGNKPYYPYFIYKIIEHEFRDDFEKLRLLDYIHLQSRETVIKNDKTYKEICDLADEACLVYCPTDPAGRL